MMIVSDSYNYRVQVFNSEGEFVCKFGSKGSEDGHFWEVRKVAINHENGDLFIPDNEHRIQVFESSLIGQDNFDPKVRRKKQCLVM